MQPRIEDDNDTAIFVEPIKEGDPIQKRIIRKKTAAKKKTAVKKPRVMKPSRKKAVRKDNTLMVRIKSVFDETAAKLKTLLPGDAAGQSSSVRAQSKK